MRTTLTTWKFQSSDRAEVAARTLRRLARENLLVVHDAETIEWETDAIGPRASQLHPITDVGALGTAFWERLFGLLFFAPRGGANGAPHPALMDVGIDDRFVTRVRDGITPGTSALFVVSPDAVVDEIQDTFAAGDAPELILTNLRHGAGSGRVAFS